MEKVGIKTSIVIIFLGLIGIMSLIFFSWILFKPLISSRRTETIFVGSEGKPKDPLKNTPLYYLGIVKKIPLSANRSVSLINHAVFSGLGVAIMDDDNNFVTWLPKAEIKSLGEGDFKYAGEIFDWWIYEDIDEDEKKELAIQFSNTGTAMVHPFYLYSYDDKKFNLLLKLAEASSKTEIKNLDSKWPEEIVYNYSLSGIGKLERDLLRWKDIWRLENGKPVKVNHRFPEEYKKLINLYELALAKKEWQPDVEVYYPTLHCLKDRARLTIQGESAEIEDCRKLLEERYHSRRN